VIAGIKQKSQAKRWRSEEIKKRSIYTNFLIFCLIKNWDPFLLGHNIHSQTIRNKS
jgi:hypothetical protein